MARCITPGRSSSTLSSGRHVQFGSEYLLNPTESITDAYGVNHIALAGDVEPGDEFTVAIRARSDSDISLPEANILTITVPSGAGSPSDSAARIAYVLEHLDAKIDGTSFGISASPDASGLGLSLTGSAEWLITATCQPAAIAGRSSMPAISASSPVHSQWTADALGHTTVSISDPGGRFSKTIFADGSFSETLNSIGGQAVTADAGGNSLPSGIIPSDLTIPAGGREEVKIEQRTTGDPNPTFYIYDATGRLTDVYLPAVIDGSTNSSTPVFPHWTYLYDAAGNEIAQIDPKEQAAYRAWLAGSRISPFTGDTRWTYDDNGRELSRTLPDGEQEALTYDDYGRMATHVDFDGNTVTYSYLGYGDPHDGMLYQVVYIGASGSGKATQTVTYTYDDLGRQQTVADASGTTTNHYDLLGNLAKVDSPEGTVHYVFDPATGRLIETWTGTAQSSATTDTLYGYDIQGQLASVTIVRQNGAAPSQTSSVTTRYDAAGDAITTSLPTTLYLYDAAGNLVKQIDPNGTKTDYDYSDFWNPSGDSTEIVTNQRGTTVLSEFTYTFNSRRQKISELDHVLDVGEATFSDTLIGWEYDPAGRLAKETYDYGNDDSSTGGKTADDYTAVYGYDLAGNRVSKTLDQGNDGTSDQKIEYAYNGDDQLTAEQTDNFDSAVQYPITTDTDLQYQTSYTYDDAGLLIQQEKTVGGTTQTSKFVYDVRGRMVRVDADGDTTYNQNGNATGNASDDTTYAYDSDSNLVAQSGGGVTSTHLLDKQNPTGYSQTLETSTGGSTPAVTYVLGSAVLAQNAGGIVSFIMPDGHGSTRQLTSYTGDSANGHVAARMTTMRSGTGSLSRTQRIPRTRPIRRSFTSTNRSTARPPIIGWRCASSIRVVGDSRHGTTSPSRRETSTTRICMCTAARIQITGSIRADSSISSA